MVRKIFIKHHHQFSHKRWAIVQQSWAYEVWVVNYPRPGLEVNLYKQHWAANIGCGCIIADFMGGISVYFYIILLFTQDNVWLIDVMKTMDVFHYMEIQTKSWDHQLFTTPNKISFSSGSIDQTPDWGLIPGKYE